MMRIHLNFIQKDVLKLIKILGQEADQRGVSAYLVGGIVRDTIQKRKNLDVDIVLESDAIAFANIVSKGLKAKMKKHFFHKKNISK